MGTDPEFSAKADDIVGLYLDPPEKARGAVRRRKSPPSRRMGFYLFDVDRMRGRMKQATLPPPSRPCPSGRPWKAGSDLGFRTCCSACRRRR